MKNLFELKMDVFGESHADEIGVSIFGLPVGLTFDKKKLQSFMKRRTPIGSPFYASTTKRREPDEVIFDRGIIEGKEANEEDNKNENIAGSTCVIAESSIVAKIKNIDIRSKDYEDISTKLRPGHADYSAFLKSGVDGLKPGGGKFSGRMTAPLCIAGGICKQLLEKEGVKIDAAIVSIGGETEAKKIESAIERTSREGDSIGGIVRCIVKNYPAGNGDALFLGLEGRLADMVFSIPAVKGIEFGSGFHSASMRGSENNDEYKMENGKIVPLSNNHGGILGGISTGSDIVFDVAFKPTPSISKPQRTVDVAEMKDTTIEINGRHDTCIVPRALPVVEAVTAIVLYDQLLYRGKLLLDDGDKLDSIRRQIDEVDYEIMNAFKRRMSLSQKVGEIKEKEGIQVEDLKREEEKIKQFRALGQPDLEDEAVELYNFLAEKSKNLQRKEEK